MGEKLIKSFSAIYQSARLAERVTCDAPVTRAVAATQRDVPARARRTTVQRLEISVDSE